MAYEEAAFSSQHSAVSEKQNQHQNQRPFTAEDAEESKTLPLSHRKPGDEQERVQDRAQALSLKLARIYEELTRLLERNPAMKRQITEGEAREDKVYQKLKLRLKMADMAPRCQWVRQDGTSCGSPQMKRHIYCFAHMQMMEARDLMLRLPPPEDANAIQVGLMRIQKAVIEDTISMKKAGLLLYSMQLALTNVGQTTFGKAKDEEMVRETMDEDEAFKQEALSSQRSAFSQEAFSNQHSAFSEKQNQHQHQRPFTAKDAEDAKESEQNQYQRQRPFTTEGTEDPEEQIGLPLMHTDDPDRNGLPRREAHDRGLESGFKPVEWRPTPDMYRTDTREGLEAYEASFRSSGERRPAQAVIAPEECAEVHANLG